jgi:hypothetical protein
MPKRVGATVMEVAPMVMIAETEIMTTMMMIEQ